jgi:hypothetical protein
MSAGAAAAAMFKDRNFLILLFLFTLDGGAFSHPAAPTPRPSIEPCTACVLGCVWGLTLVWQGTGGD